MTLHFLFWISKTHTSSSPSLIGVHRTMRTALTVQLSTAAAAAAAAAAASRCGCQISSALSTLGCNSTFHSRHYSMEGLGVSYGLNWALAGRGVIVKDKAFYNLNPSELQKNGATVVEKLSGVPLYMRGDATAAASKISKAQFGKLLKQVTSHISSISKIFVQDGAIGLSPECDAKVRVISDNPAAILSFSNILWETHIRGISHDSCPITAYVASSVSQNASEILGLGSAASTGFAAADIERSSLILCGKAFADAKAIKDALSAMVAPIVSARGGLPLSARVLVSGDSVVLLFAPETIKSLPDVQKALVSDDSGVVLSSDGITPFFRAKDSVGVDLPKKPASVIFIALDSTGILPSVSKLSSGQAAYHFLAGFQDGKFVPTYSKGPSPVDPMDLAKALYAQLKESEIPSFLINATDGGKPRTGKDLLELMNSALANKLPQRKLDPADPKVGDLKGRYKSFFSDRFQELPEEFFF